jgi:Secretion system C-terminal sorting domain
MNKLLTLLLLICAFTVKGQPPYIERREIVSTQNSFYPEDFVLIDNAVYVSGYNSNVIILPTFPHLTYYSESNIQALKTDTFGNVLWDVKLKDTRCEEYISRKPNMAFINGAMYYGGVVVASQDSAENFHGPLNNCDPWPSSVNPDMVVMKTTEDGNLVWSKCYGGYDTDYLAVLLENNGKILLGGSVNVSAMGGDYTNPVSTVIGDRDIWLVEVDPANGSIIREKCFGTPTGEDNMSSITLTRDNGYLLSGFTNYYNSLDIILIKLDSLWNIEWQNIITTPGIEIGIETIEDTTTGAFYSLINTTERDSIFVTNQQGDINYSNWIVKFSSTGNLDWTTFIGTPYDENFASTNLLINDRNEIVVTTVSDKEDTGIGGGRDVHFIKVDTTGSVIINKILPDFNVIEDMIALGNDRYLCLASFNNYQYELITLGNTVGIEEKPAGAIAIYPNPAQNIVSIKMPDYYKENTLLIYNLTGQLIYQKAITSVDNIDIGELGNGLYLFVVESAGAVIGRQRVVVSR